MYPLTNARWPVRFYKTLKIISIIGIFFLFIINYYILLTTPSAKTYEVSIYNAYPRILWVNFILVDVISLSWILLDKEDYNKDRTLMLIILFMNQLTVLLLPVFRGYFIYGRCDVLEHLGRVKDILNTGHVGSDNFYPLMHILISSLVLIPSASLNRLTILLPAFFCIMLLIWYYIFINSSINQDIAKIFIIGWMLFPLGYWHTSMVGNMFSYVFMFLILGTWLSKISKTKKYILVSILYISLVYFHPLTSMYLFLILIFLDIISRINNPEETFRHSQKFVPNMATIILAIWFTWYLSFRPIQISFVMFWMSLANPGKNPFLSMYISNINNYHLSIYTLIKFATYRYFGVGLFSLTALVLIWRTLRKKQQPDFHSKGIPNAPLYQIFIPLFFIFVAWSFINLFLHFVNFERSLRYVLAFSLPLGSIILFREIPVKHAKTSILLILLLAYFSIFTVHMSPLSGNLNRQVSPSEYFGTGWLFYNRNPNIIAYDDGQITQYRFYEAWFGRDKTLEAKNILFYGKGRSLIPEHFGYNRYNLVGEIFSKPRYFIMGRAVWSFYDATISGRMQYWRWLPSEYVRMKVDPTVAIVYSSNDISIYWITPLRIKRV